MRGTSEKIDQEDIFCSMFNGGWILEWSGSEMEVNSEQNPESETEINMDLEFDPKSSDQARIHGEGNDKNCRSQRENF